MNINSLYIQRIVIHFILPKIEHVGTYYIIIEFYLVIWQRDGKCYFLVDGLSGP